MTSINRSHTLVVLGATSSVAHAYLRLVASQNTVSKFVLVARNSRKLETVARDISARSSSEVVTIRADLGEPTQVEATMADIWHATDSVSECLITYGALGDQQLLQEDLQQLQSLLETNFVSTALWLEQMAAVFQEQGEGHAVVIGSVAGDRGRQSNYIYGATKAGLERLCEGLAHRFATSKHIHFTCIKPGFIDTPMTDHLEKSGPLWASPEKVASLIQRAVKNKRVRVYVPGFWRMIMLVVRSLPVPVFHRTKL